MAWEEEKKAMPALKKVWHFIWHDDSIWSWLVNLVLAFVLIKFIVFPVLGLIFSTGYPIVAVVSSSMEHQGNFEQFWGKAGAWYENKNIVKEHGLEIKYTDEYGTPYAVTPEKFQIQLA